MFQDQNQGGHSKSGEIVLEWLRDAYAMEQGSITALENHARDAGDHPEVAAKLQEHLGQTRRQAELVRGCVERLGGSTSAAKTAMGKVATFLQGVGVGAAADELVKNNLTDIAAEHFEIACYQALIAGAQSIGDQETVRVCQQIMQEEQQMARWLEGHLATTVQEHLAMHAGARA